MSNDHKFSFHGSGSKLFGIVITNLIFTILTLGFYYPWAKVALLKYLYKETELAGGRFTFHGTGKEVFKGFIKAIVLFLILYGVIFILSYYGLIILGTIFSYLAIIALLPFIIHGSLRYRLSRSSWRGIHFGYRGNLKELTKIVYKNVFFTIITFGIYAAWMKMNIRRYTIGHIRYGDVTFKYNGKGGDFFSIYIVGYLLTIITLGIYMPWWMKELINYYYEKTELIQGDVHIPLKSTVTGEGIFVVGIINILIIIFTLGIGMPWAKVRFYKYLAKNLYVDPAFNPDIISQTEEEYKDATGDDLGDLFEIDII